MDLQHLPQQRKQSGNVFFLGFTNVHLYFIPSIFWFLHFQYTTPGGT